MWTWIGAVGSIGWIVAYHDLYPRVSIFLGVFAAACVGFKIFVATRD